MIQIILRSIASLAALAALGFAAQPGEAVNANCPVSKKSIDGSTFSEVSGHKVGFCCGRCPAAFASWSEADKTAFIEAATQDGKKKAKKAAEPAQEQGEKEKGESKSDPYLLDTCPVSGEELGSMGEPVAMTIEGRKVRFCCESCVDPYKADPAKFAQRIDAAMADQQRPYYPVDTCVVSGEKLDDKAVEVVHKNRLFRLCCADCKAELEKNASKYVTQLDRAALADQGPKYPLKVCPISGEELGSMGKPVELVSAGRLVRLCCKNCRKPFNQNPQEAIAQIDAAWKPIHARGEAAAGSKGSTQDGGR